MFPLTGGGLLGLWAAADVEPAIAGRGTEGELAFKVDSPAEVDRLHERWSHEQLPIAQHPTDMDSVTPSRLSTRMGIACG